MEATKITLQNTVVAHTVQVQSQPVDSLRNRTTKCLETNPKSIWTCDVSSPKDSTKTSPYATGTFQASLTCSTCYYYMFWCENLLTVWCAVTLDSKSISITWEAEFCMDIDGSRALLVDCHSNDEDQGDIEMSGYIPHQEGNHPRKTLEQPQFCSTHQLWRLTKRISFVAFSSVNGLLCFLLLVVVLKTSRHHRQPFRRPCNSFSLGCIRLFTSHLCSSQCPPSRLYGLDIFSHEIVQLGSCLCEHSRW